MTSKNDQKVAVAYAHPSDLSSKFHTSLIRLLVLDAEGARVDGEKVGGRGRITRGGAHIPVHSGAQITKTRNRIVHDFLALEGIDWLWMVDADMTFDPDILERLIAAAHPTERPIVGGLCFAYMRDQPRKFWPTMYAYVPGTERLRRLTSYPADSLVPVAATGAACTLIHRSVLEQMQTRFPPPWPWYAETPFYEKNPDGSPDLSTGDAYSEDITFCLRAQAAGFPVYVHTGIRLGHVKEFEADEEGFLAESAMLAEANVPVLPTFVVIPVKKGEREEMTQRLVSSLAVPPDFIRCDDSDRLITEKWNDGLDWAASHGFEQYNVAVLNNDLEVPLEFLAQLEAGLRVSDDHWVSYPNVHDLDLAPGQPYPTSGEGQTMSGFAFMLRGEAGLRFDPQFEWWYSDTDLEFQVRAAGKQVVCVGGCFVNHLEPTRSTYENPDLLDIARQDEKRFAAKWNLDPATLFLARQ